MNSWIGNITVSMSKETWDEVVRKAEHNEESIKQLVIDYHKEMIKELRSGRKDKAMTIGEFADFMERRMASLATKIQERL